jgi:hypothetical protein
MVWGKAALEVGGKEDAVVVMEDLRLLSATLNLAAQALLLSNLHSFALLALAQFQGLSLHLHAPLVFRAVSALK